MSNRKNKNNNSRSTSGNNRHSNSSEYNSTPSSRFYTAKEEVTLRFYQVPKSLFKNPIYKGLSLGAKLMYSILRDRLDISIKNNWEDENGYIYLIFSGEDLLNLLEISKNTVTKYKGELVKYKLIIDKRLGQGKANRIYILKPDIKEFQNPNNWESRIPKNSLLESQKIRSIDTNVNHTDLNNVNRAINEEPVDNSVDINDIKNKIRNSFRDKKDKISEYPSIKRRSAEKEQLAKEISEEMGDDHSLGAFRTIVDKIPEQQIRIFFSIIKDTHLTGKIKNNKGAMFISIAKAYARKNIIDLNFK